MQSAVGGPADPKNSARHLGGVLDGIGVPMWAPVGRSLVQTPHSLAHALRGMSVTWSWSRRQTG
jgi:hypothetical protein